MGDLRVHRKEREVHGLRAAVLITFNEQLQRKQRRSFDVGLRRLSAAMWKPYHEHKGQSPNRMCKALQRTHVLVILQKGAT